MERAFAILFSSFFLIACINCKEIAAAASRRKTSIQTALAFLQLDCQWNRKRLWSSHCFMLNAVKCDYTPHTLRKEEGLRYYTGHFRIPPEQLCYHVTRPYPHSKGLCYARLVGGMSCKIMILEVRFLLTNFDSTSATYLETLYLALNKIN